MACGHRLVSVACADRLFQVHYKRARRAMSQRRRLTNVNNSPEHGSVLRGMVGFRRGLRFTETTQHYCRPGCSSMFHRSE